MAEIVEKIFSTAGLEYSVAGGLATYPYVEKVAPDAGRLTRDIDVLMRREDLDRIAEAAKPFGYQHRQVDGVDMLVQSSEPTVRRAVHLLFAVDSALGECRRIRDIRVIPLAELIRMKLTSNRLKDGAHIIDLDEAGLITPDIEATLTPILRERLAEARTRG